MDDGRRTIDDGRTTDEDEDEDDPASPREGGASPWQARRAKEMRCADAPLEPRGNEARRLNASGTVLSAVRRFSCPWT